MPCAHMAQKWGVIIAYREYYEPPPFGGYWGLLERAGGMVGVMIIGYCEEGVFSLQAMGF